MGSTDEALGRSLAEQTRRQMGELSRARIRRCLDELEDEEIWHRPGATTVSIGNLILHLAGNVRQWIVASLGGAVDDRRRQEEFDTQGPLPRAELLARLDAAVDEALAVIEALKPADLLAPHRIQGFEETGLSAILHVVEHFSYHVGQISLMTKLAKSVDLGYYDDDQLDITGG
jgi:uncharacterized damage-inducible protein DinB